MDKISLTVTSTTLSNNVKKNLKLPNNLLNKVFLIYLSLLTVEKHLPENPQCLTKKRSVCENENENDIVFLGV